MFLRFYKEYGGSESFSERLLKISVGGICYIEMRINKFIAKVFSNATEFEVLRICTRGDFRWKITIARFRFPAVKKKHRRVVTNLSKFCPPVLFSI